MMIVLNSEIVINKNILTTMIDDELGMMHVEKGYYYTLNPVGKRIWALIQEKITVDKLIKALLEIYNVSEKQCLEEVVDLLEILKINGLVEVVN